MNHCSLCYMEAVDDVNLFRWLLHETVQRYLEAVKEFDSSFMAKAKLHLLVHSEDDVVRFVKASKCCPFSAGPIGSSTRMTKPPSRAAAHGFFDDDDEDINNITESDNFRDDNQPLLVPRRIRFRDLSDNCFLGGFRLAHFGVGVTGGCRSIT